MAFSPTQKRALSRAAATGSQRGEVRPAMLYLLLLAIVFALDSLQNWFTPTFLPFLQSLPYTVYDPLITTLFVAPFLWLLVVRPLQQGVRDEKLRHQAISAQVVEAVVSLDQSGAVISFNPAAERIFGYAPEEISGLNAAALFCDTALTAENLELLANSAEEPLPKIRRVTCHRKDGKPLTLEISVSRLLVAGTLQFLVVMRDITRRIMMERDASTLQSRLLQANKMTALGLMVSGVAHEVNNPNNFILSNAQLLERSCGDIIKILRQYYRENGEFQVGGLPFSEMEQHFPEMIAGIIGGTQRIDSIINDLKTFVRQGSGEQFEQIDLNGAVKSAVSIVRSQIQLHTTRFSLDLAESLPLVNGNSQQLGQVVINLLMNACQSLTDSDGAVSLRTWFDPQTSTAVISVSDEGEGVQPADRDHLIEPFFTTRRQSGGTGLGLTISHSIIKGHNGTITFETVPGHGTTFHVRIPVICSETSLTEGA